MKDIVYFHENSILPQQLFYKDLIIWPVRISDAGAELIINPSLNRPEPIKDACGRIIGQTFTLDEKGEGIDLVLDFDENRNRRIEAHGSHYSLSLINTTSEVIENHRFFVAEIEIEEILRTALESAQLLARCAVPQDHDIVGNVFCGFPLIPPNLLARRCNDPAIR